MKRVRVLTVTAIFSAVGFLLLYLGSLAEILDLAVVMFVSLFVTFAVIEFRGPWPYLIYAVTGTLALLFLPNRFTAVEYLGFGGIYPVIKYYWEKLPRLPSVCGKLASFNLLAVALFFIGTRLFGLQIPYGGWYYAALWLLANVTFVFYDILLTRLIIRYCRSFRARILKLLRR